MPTLYVESVPAELYEALRRQARTHRRSIAAEVIVLLQEAVPTAKELKARERLFAKLTRLRANNPAGPGPFPSTEEMQRQDRGR